MAPAICFFVNTLFSNLFKESRLFFNEVSACDLVCARTDNFLGRVEFLILNIEESSEAELVAKRIINLKSEFNDSLKEWNDIAILVRKRAAFTELQKAFIKYQIAFNIVGGTGFYQKQSISDIYNYFTFLLNDKDDAPLIGILRSSFFLVSDVKILELLICKGDSYWEKLKSASLNTNSFWQKIQERLNENKELANRVSIPLLLRKRFSLVGFAGYGAAWNDFTRVDDKLTVVTGGTGFRYEIARAYGLHMGVDLAFGPDTTAIYVQFGSAWMRP